jgi:hypothetical protein
MAIEVKGSGRVGPERGPVENSKMLWKEGTAVRFSLLQVEEGLGVVRKPDARGGWKRKRAKSGKAGRESRVDGGLFWEMFHVEHF